MRFKLKPSINRPTSLYRPESPTVHGIIAIQTFLGCTARQCIITRVSSSREDGILVKTGVGVQTKEPADTFEVVRNLCNRNCSCDTAPEASAPKGGLHNNTYNSIFDTRIFRDENFKNKHAGINISAEFR